MILTQEIVIHVNMATKMMNTVHIGIYILQMNARIAEVVDIHGVDNAIDAMVQAKYS